MIWFVILASVLMLSILLLPLGIVLHLLLRNYRR
jgi:hypothetical protein